MKTLTRFLPLTAVLMLLSGISCAQRGTHFISDKQFRNQVHEDFLARKITAASRADDLFAVMEHPDLSLEQVGALEFLYAYMPLCDLADMDGDFFLRQVDGAFRAREYFDWGKKIPEEIFRHYVMPYRVNNEYLDEARDVFFDQLKDRIAGMSMEEAVLEVNHWCHEKVTYRATDPRTSAPLALIKTSWGRCGEEATFTVAALRAVGIPARQCYTPRWAHTDSNHAWVEAWVDGTWYYLGACEPEPELDMAWFTGPAKRAMMVHTNIEGPYFGPEEVNYSSPFVTRINLLDKYADTRTVTVTITDQSGRPIEGARLSYNVYNYAEFSPISATFTDPSGRGSITTGYGDLLIWATDGQRYGYTHCSPQENDVTVVVDRFPGTAYEQTFVMAPPAEKKISAPDPQKIAANRIRLAYEDSIRNAYMATFASEDYARRLAGRIHLDPDRTWQYIEASQGNWEDIADFITDNRDNPLLLDFLGSMREKDLRDTPAAVLQDHLDHSNRKYEGLDDDMIARWILSPRIENEIIKPWRSHLYGNGPFAGRTDVDPAEIIDFISANVEILEGENYYNCMLTPEGVDRLGKADVRSRNIYFVALCRTAGIPARVESATRKPQYFSEGEWYDVMFSSDQAAVVKPKGTLTLMNDPDNIVKPGYGTHYAVAVFLDGNFQTLELRNNREASTYPFTTELDEGYYRLLVGSRANDGSVTIHTEYFNISEGDRLEKTITLPQIEGKLFVKGIVDMNSNVILDDGEKYSLKDIADGRGLMLCFVDPDKEPSKHVLQDLPVMRDDFEKWGGTILFMVPEDAVSVSFDKTAFRGLPQKVLWGTDHGRELLNQSLAALQSEFGDNFPLTLYLSPNGGILYSLEGYKIGIGEDVIRTIRLEAASYGN